MERLGQMQKELSLFQKTHADDLERFFQQIRVFPFEVFENLVVGAQDAAGEQVPLL